MLLEPQETPTLDPQRAFNLGFGAVSPLWPAYAAAAGAGLAYWWWKGVARGAHLDLFAETASFAPALAPAALQQVIEEAAPAVAEVPVEVVEAAVEAVAEPAVQAVEPPAVEAPVIETQAVEAPVIEAPVIEAPAVEPAVVAAEPAPAPKPARAKAAPKTVAKAD